MGNILSESDGAEEMMNEVVMSTNEVSANNHHFGWLRDLPDRRDRWKQWPLKLKELERSKDLRANLPEVYDQGALGSCTSNAIVGAFSYEHNKENLGNFSGSRLFVYYNERVLENDVEIDAGAYIRDGMKVINSIGVCEESLCPYRIRRFREEPSPEAFNDASHHKGIKYERIAPTVDEFKKAISNDLVVIFGFSVPSSFELIGPDGIMSEPAEGESIIGGHAVLACGYDDDVQRLLVRNSWGPLWGANGYFWMPYSFVTKDNCDDCWILEIVRDE
jgi:C1A family cysteine protease